MRRLCSAGSEEKINLHPRLACDGNRREQTPPQTPPAEEPEPWGLRASRRHRGRRGAVSSLVKAALRPPATPPPPPYPNDIRQRVSSLRRSSSSSPSPFFALLSHRRHLPLTSPSLSPPLRYARVRQAAGPAPVAATEPVSHSAFNEQSLCVPSALMEPKWPTHFTLPGLDPSGWTVTDLMASLWSNTMLGDEAEGRWGRKQTEQKKWWNTAPLVCNLLFLFSLFCTEVGQWNVRWRLSWGGFKEHGLVWWPRRFHPLCVRVNTHLEAFHSPFPPTWTADIWWQGISTAPVND